MSSEHDESAELLEDLSMKSDAEKSGSPPPKKFQGSGEHAKPKRRGRRGKKRKQRKASGAAESENQDDSETHPETETNRDSPTWDSDQELDCETNAYNDVIIRPVNVPKAPENSTQFIIDDHNLCQLYMSFETPNPYLATDQPESDRGENILEPAGIDAAYIDIDFEYDPPQDFDNSAYYDKEFEISYKSNRFDELLRLPRSELVSGLRVLEARLKELSDDLVKENPSPILEQLQAELLELQEKHNVLKDTNTSLTGLLANCKGESPIAASVGSSQQNVTLSNKTTLDKTIVFDQSPVLGITFKISPREVAIECLQDDGDLFEEAVMKTGIVADRNATEALGRTMRKSFQSISEEYRSTLPDDATSGLANSKLSGGLAEVKSSSGRAEVKSSSELEQAILPCRDLHGCDEPTHSVTSDDHERSAAVLV